MNLNSLNINDILSLIQGLRNSGISARYAGESSLQGPALAFGREQLGEQGRQFDVTSALQKRLADEEIRRKQEQDQRARSWLDQRDAWMSNPWVALTPQGRDSFSRFFQNAPTGY